MDLIEAHIRGENAVMQKKLREALCAFLEAAALADYLNCPQTATLLRLRIGGIRLKLTGHALERRTNRYQNGAS